MQEKIKLIQNKWYFYFIKEKDLREALELFSSYVFYLVESQEKCNNDKLLIEFKKHSIEIYMWAIVEAMVYYFTKEKLWNNEKAKRKFLQIEELKIYQKIKNSDFIICKKEKKEISFNDTINFKWLIDWLKDKKIIDKKLFLKIDNFRKARNSIHINVYKNWEKIFKDLEKIFKDFKEIRLFIKENLKK